MRVYLYDAYGRYAGFLEVDPEGDQPERSTPQEPPALTGTQEARWEGDRWRKYQPLD